ALLPQQVHVTAELGFLLSAMQPMVESEIRRLLAEKLA
ncbi:polyhydroxyalkanoic acid synthase, partial [Xanthomonas oryzae pv. oryzae]